MTHTMSPAGFQGDIIGLQLAAACRPTLVWHDTTGPTGVITLTCGATFRNATRDTLRVWAVARSPAPSGLSLRYRWLLRPGAVTVELPPPPPGLYWELYTETAFQHLYGSVAVAAGLGLGLGLAVVGAIAVGEAIAHHG
jgi:hypothetical protein